MSQAGLINPSVVPITPIVRTLKFELSSTQVKSLKATPIQILAAPGLNKVYNPVSISVRYVYGGNSPFTNSSPINVYFGNPSSLIMVNLADNTLISGTSSGYSIYYPLGSFFSRPVGQADNQPIYITIIGSSEITGNVEDDNYFVCELNYIIQDLNDI